MNKYQAEMELQEVLRELKFWTGRKHEGECCFTDKSDEGCYLCAEAEKKRFPITQEIMRRYSQPQRCPNRELPLGEDGNCHYPEQPPTGEKE